MPELAASWAECLLALKRVVESEPGHSCGP